MEIDVIIPLYKPGKELFTLLDKLGSQSVPVLQVIDRKSTRLNSSHRT